MTKTKATRDLERRLWNYTHSGPGNAFACFEVTIGVSVYNSKKQIVDFLSYKNNDFRAYEIKVTLADLNSKNALSLVGDFNYLVLTKELWDKIQKMKQKPEALWFAGVMIPKGDDSLQCVRKSGHPTVTFGKKALLMESMVRSMDRELNKVYSKRMYDELEADNEN
ncbi:hypothetical protein M3M38_07330 [Fructilactobacillus cliffordii]|uniref:hypothetical protein n=1 Tax=Fructilactobacillus cliffordii TaxID=2940299 RepID=UPI0020932BE7|nr:hypothetical protein [Fructilactobacillus cliffordii]USS86471.1 hypothetical protein M3M38_07330 [Fructilactobacillus cliffordii]